MPTQIEAAPVSRQSRVRGTLSFDGNEKHESLLARAIQRIVDKSYFQWLVIAAAVLLAGAMYVGGLYVGSFYAGRPFAAFPMSWGTWLVVSGFSLSFAIVLGRFRIALGRERAASKLKSEMLSLVSHEFSNMLAIMKTSLYMLEDEKILSPQEKNIYDMLRRVHLVLFQIAENFLNQARMESGKFLLNLKKTCLSRTIQDTVRLLQPLSDQKSIRIVVEMPVNEICVRADRVGLALVLQNLIGNAIKYSQQGGLVRVRVELPKKGGSRVSVSVQDHGIGIDPQDAEKVFSGYYRTQSARNAAKGFGVGLKVSREIVEGHGSGLEMKSVPRRGTRFTFSLEYLGICDGRMSLLGGEDIHAVDFANSVGASGAGFLCDAPSEKHPAQPGPRGKRKF